MVQSFTVENYLKAIYQAQAALADPDALVQMGRLARLDARRPGHRDDDGRRWPMRDSRDTSHMSGCD